MTRKPSFPDWWIADEMKKCARVVDACNAEIPRCLMGGRRAEELAERRRAAHERRMTLWAMSTLPSSQRSWPAAVAELRELLAQERELSDGERDAITAST